MNTNFRQQLREEFDLTPPMATWIVATHIFVLACPLALIWAVDNFGARLPQSFAYPTLVSLASAIYIGATAFEVAQNSADRWYLTEATRSVADLFFNGFMTLAFLLYIVAFLGFGWIALAAAVLTALYPLAYIWNHPSHRGLSGTVVLLATGSLYFVTGDPAVFLFLLGTGVGVYFITFLIERHAQIFHGWGALSFGLGFLAWPWAVVNAANGTPLSWTWFAGISAAVILGLALLRPLLKRAKATPHQYT
ncbi:MAG: hypothetical protein ACR2QB_08795 [Gammaproteobacteria bacterium]